MALKQSKRLDDEYMKKAKGLGLLDQKHFRQAVEAYNFQIELAEMLRSRIRKEGTTILIPAGKDGTKMVSNPAVADLNKAEILAQKLRLELDKKMTTALENQESAEDAEL